MQDYSTCNNNLAGVRNTYSNGGQESASLLDNRDTSTNFISRPRRTISCTNTQNQNNIQLEGPHVLPSLGGPSQPTRRKVGQFLKSLVSRKSTKENITAVSSLISTNDLKVEKSESESSLTNLTQSRRVGNSTTSLNLVNQKLWSVMPLLRRENSCSSLVHASKTVKHSSAGMRKCNTVLALANSTNLEPITPLNRLRKNTSFGTCSRCSSLLSLAAGSKYSINLSNGDFMPVNNTNTISSENAEHVLGNITCSIPQQVNYSCKLCLGDVKVDKLTKISQCGCSFCTEVLWFLLFQMHFFVIIVIKLSVHDGVC